MFFIKLFCFIKCLGFIIGCLAIGLLMLWMGIILIIGLIFKLIHKVINKKVIPSLK